MHMSHKAVLYFACITSIALSSCGKDSPTRPSTPAPPPPPAPPPDPVPTSISITPSDVKLTGFGQSIQLRAAVIDQNGGTITGASVTWSSANTAVASVSAQGLVTAVMNGVTQVTARSGDVYGRVNVSVMAPTPNRSPEPVGEFAPLMLVEGEPPTEVEVSGGFRDPDDDNLKFTARSSDEQVVTVTVSGSKLKVVPVSAGNTTVKVTASDGDLSAEQSMIVIVSTAGDQGVDLVVESPEISTTDLGVGKRFTFSITVRNQGNTDADSTVMHFLLSSDVTISTDDTAVDTIQVGPIDAYEATGHTELFLRTVTAPSIPGVYFYGACIDPVADESNTENNCSDAVEVTVRGPDLIVESVSASKVELNAGERFDLFATVRNQSDIDAVSSTTLRAFLSTDSTISIDDTELDTESIRRLDASETSEARFSFIAAPTVPGTYYIGACLDPNAEESNTLNNCSGAVEVTVRGPDLLVENPTVSDNRPGAGDRFTLSATVRNQGAGDVVSATTLRAYLSSDSTISSDDMEIDSTFVPFLKASEASEERFFLSAPAVPGTYYYGVCVEPLAEESNTHNNCSDAVKVTVGPTDGQAPDLIVESVEISESILNAGARFTLSAAVRNRGDGDTRSSTTLRYYRSPDATISAEDSEEGTDHVFSLDASETSDESIRLTAPDEAGTYYYGACVDPVTGESDTQNNCSSAVSITVNVPDLIVESVEVSETNPNAGDRFTLSATVKNRGMGDAGSSTTLRYYRSPDATISAEDTEEGTDYVISLDASETSDESIRLNAPDGPGTYYYGACVDSLPEESDTTNNCSVAVSLTIGQTGNRAPVSVGMIPDQSINTDEVAKFDVTSYFSDPDNDTLTYSASSSEQPVATVTMESAEVSVRGETAGTAAITIKASDGSLTASQTFNVIVRDPAGQGPDLIVESLTASKDAVDEGEFFSLYATVRNVGDRNTRFPTILSYYVSTVDSISVSDSRVNIGQVPPLDSTESNEVPASIPAPIEQGTYYYYACVHPVAGEFNEENNCSDFVQVAVGFTPGAPDAPAHAVFRREGNTNIVSWSPSPSATYYNLYESRIPREFFASELTSNIEGTSYEHTGTSGLFDYFYWVQACNDHGCSDLYWVGPPVRQGIEVIERDEGSLTIRLYAMGYLTHFVLYQSDMASGGFNEKNDSIESEEEVVTYVDDGLMDNTTYFYKAKACNRNGCSEFTNVSGGVTEVAGPVEVPPAPGGVVGEEVDIPLGPNDGRVSWNATPRATYYIIHEDGQYEATVSAPQNYYYDSSPNTFIGSLVFTQYTVFACNKAGCGPGVSVCISCY